MTDPRFVAAIATQFVDGLTESPVFAAATEEQKRKACLLAGLALGASLPRDVADKVRDATNAEYTGAEEIEAIARIVTRRVRGDA